MIILLYTINILQKLCDKFTNFLNKCILYIHLMNYKNYLHTHQVYIKLFSKLFILDYIFIK